MRGLPEFMLFFLAAALLPQYDQLVTGAADDIRTLFDNATQCFRKFKQTPIDIAAQQRVAADIDQRRKTEEQPSHQDQRRPADQASQ